MSTAKLNVWVTKLGDPWSIVNQPYPGYQWVVAVANCGGVVNWSEGRYRHHSDDAWTPIQQHAGPGGVMGWWYDSIPTLDGHVEIELPPGSYSVIASLHTWFVEGVLYGNWYTDHAIVHLPCGQESCATLYAPSEMSCHRRLYDFVIPLLIKHGVIAREAGDRAIQAMRAAFNRKMSPFEEQEMELLRRAFERMDQEPQKKSG